MNKIIEDELYNEIFNLENIPFDWAKVNPDTKNKIFTKMSELKERLELEMVKKQTVKKPKTDKFADKKGILKDKKK